MDNLPNWNGVINTEYSNQFDNLRVNAMMASYKVYGPAREAYSKIDRIGNLETCIKSYKQSKDPNLLVSIANLAMIEYMITSDNN